jgi:enoyl-CoA hydratase/carnithine racemase
MKDRYSEHVTAGLHPGHIAEIRIERTPSNFVSVELLAAVADACADADKEPQVRAIVLTAAGKAFCAGADLASPSGVGGAGMQGINPLYDQAVRLFSVEKPMVAAVQGAAVGAGLGLALVTDFRVASHEARFVANFTKLGFHPGFGLTHTLPRLIGHQRAALMFLTGRRIKPDEALAWGLVDQVVAEGELRDAAFSLAREIAENAPLAIVSTRKTLRADLARLVREATDREYVEQIWLRETEDFKEGVRSVNERRVGTFVGR